MRVVYGLYRDFERSIVRLINQYHRHRRFINWFYPFVLTSPVYDEITSCYRASDAFVKSSSMYSQKGIS